MVGTAIPQEMRTSSYFEAWTSELVERSGTSRRRFATSARGRPMYLVQAGAPDARRHVLLTSRQHPPEVTGTMALVAFLEEMLGGSPLAREFRERFRIHVVPLMNPDGVDLGHWRHNTGGVDPALIRQVAETAARGTVRILLREWYVLNDESR